MPAVIGSPDDAADAWRPHHIKLIYYRDDEEEEEAVWGNDGETATFDLCACACRVHHVGSWRVARWRVLKRCAHAAFRFPMTKAGRLRQSSKGGKRSSAAFNLRLVHVHLIRCSPSAVATTLRLYGRTNVLVFLVISPTTDPSSRHLQLKNETKKFQKQTGKLEMRAIDRCCCCCC